MDKGQNRSRWRDGKLFVDGADQRILIINDLKRAGKQGPFALWMEQSTDAYFCHLLISNQ